jgi:hypothetical protein
VTSTTTVSEYLAVGAGTNSFGITTDGTTFSGLNRLNTFSTQGNGIFYDPVSNKWVAVGQGGNTIATSSDGVSWTGRGTFFTTSGNDVIYDCTKWIAVGSGGNTVATSSNGGVTWSGQAVSYFVSANSINYSLPLNPTTTTTTYDASLNPSTVTVATPSYIMAGVKTSSLWVAVGTPGVGALLYSRDGITWTPTNTVSYNAYFVTYANNVWIMGGSNESAGYPIATSTDGITWTGIINSDSHVLGRSAAYGNGLWVIVGFNAYFSNTISTSINNGTSWTNRGGTIFTSSGFGVAYANNLWVAVGQGGNTIATSTDGINWTGRGSTVFTTAGYKVTYANNLWIAVGSGGNTIATSTDGINWTGSGATI